MSREVVELELTGIVFDVDGTIADTDPIHGEAWSQATETVTGSAFSVDAYLDACVDGAMSPRQFIGPVVGDDQWDAVEAEKRRIYPDMLRAKARPNAGLIPLLQRAHETGLKVAIVSSSSAASVEAMLEAIWPAQAPDVVVARSNSVAAKPDPAPYRSALRELGLEAAAVVAFEDSPSGVKAAIDAGLRCVQIGSAETAAEMRVDDFTACELTSNGPHQVLRVSTC